MHTFGKVCLWTSVLLLFGAYVVSAKLYTQRAQYVNKKVQLEEKLAKNEKDLTDLRVKAVETRRELAATLLGWDRMPWNNVGVTVFKENSTLQIKLGTIHGLLPSDNSGDQTKQQVVHCFQPGENGDFSYVGDFRVTTVDNEQAALTPNWNVLPGESDSWNAEKPWRVRAMVPSQYQTRFNGLELQLTVTGELLASKEEDLEKQKRLLAGAEQRRDQRIAEIVGPKGDVADAEKRPREDVVGLLTGLEEAEETRNTALANADHLRRVLLQTLTNFERMQAENLRLVDSLPKGTQSKTSRVTTR